MDKAYCDRVRATIICYCRGRKVGEWKRQPNQVGILQVTSIQKSQFFRRFLSKKGPTSRGLKNVRTKSTGPAFEVMIVRVVVN